MGWLADIGEEWGRLNTPGKIAVGGAAIGVAVIGLVVAHRASTSASGASTSASGGQVLSGTLSPVSPGAGQWWVPGAAPGTDPTASTAPTATTTDPTAGAAPTTPTAPITLPVPVAGPPPVLPVPTYASAPYGSVQGTPGVSNVTAVYSAPGGNTPTSAPWYAQPGVALAGATNQAGNGPTNLGAFFPTTPFTQGTPGQGVGQVVTGQVTANGGIPQRPAWAIRV